MDLQQRIELALKEALREKNEDRRDAVRALLTSMKNKEKELRRSLDEGEIQQLIVSQVKQRRDSAEQYSKAGRDDLKVKEEREILALEAFLPQQLTLSQLDKLIQEAIQDTGATTLKDMGKVMKQLMPKVTGRADGRTLNERVRAKLES